MAIKKLCIPFVNKDLVDALAIKDGKVGTYVLEGSFLRGTNPESTTTRTLKLVSGITKVVSNWDTTAGPFDTADLEDGSLNLVVISAMSYNNYVLRIGTNLYAPTDTSVPAIFDGDIVVHPENIQNNETITVGKVFKAFKLEE